MNVKTIIVSIENLVAGYNGKPVLHELNLHLQKGEICCVIGEEGVGKSTLLKALVQQLPSSGKISYDGTDLSTISTANLGKEGIDFIAQGGSILRGFTIEEHIRLALSGKSKVHNSRTWKEIEQTFPRMILLKKQFAGRLSGGERMLLSMSCLLATDADFWILDEPTAGLAPETCKTIGNFLLRMRNDRGKTMLLMEHNYDFAFEIADSIVTLKQGTLSEKYLGDVFRQPGFIENKLYGSRS